MVPRLAALLALAGAVLLPVSLFLDWYKVVLPDADDVTVTGWETFEAVDGVLVLVSIAALVWLLGPRLGMQRWPRSVPALAGILATVVVVLQLIEPPPLLSALEVGGEVKRESGAWLGLGGALLVLASGLLQLVARRSESKAAAVERADLPEPE